MHSLTLCLASNRPDNLRTFLGHHGKHEGVTIAVVVDPGDECYRICKDYGAIPVLNPRPDLGYYGLHHGYEIILNTSRADFITILNDEVRYPEGWHERLQLELDKAIERFPDRIFRLRLSEFRHKTYTHISQCIRCPENYSITSREWYGLAGIGEFWGPDSWHQCIESYLAFMYEPRGIPIDDFAMTGTAAGKGILLLKDRDMRRRRIKEGWKICQEDNSHVKYVESAIKLWRYIEHATKINAG